MKKKIMIVVIMVFLVALSIEAASSYKFYKKLIKRQEIGKVREYWTEELDLEIVTSRGDDIIIEKLIGTVVNTRKDGRIIGVEAGHNYISYKCVKGVRKGDTILTICIYTPGNTYCDDICERFDYIIDRVKK